MATIKDLKKIRLKRGITQYELANHLGIQEYLISLYETGKKEMPPEQLEEALEFVGYEGLTGVQKDIKELVEELKERKDEYYEYKDRYYWLEIQKFLYQIYKDNK